MICLIEKKILNRFVDQLPRDPSINSQSREVLNSCYSLITPAPVSNPSLLAWSNELAQQFAIKTPDQNSEDLHILAGNTIHPEMKPFAACYGGHQFGHWANQLGDGRAITLGELEDASGKLWELQLKGAGPTPYSRSGDGRAVLRSSLREFIASEAMFHLGVPSTRALSLIKTGDPVVRDMFYDGNPLQEPGAITSRMAPTFLRFGNFEIHASRKDHVTLQKLTDWAITHHFPQIKVGDSNYVIQFFKEICHKTALLMIEWERVGFVHGVMNTDNMSILGLTIDYGPFGWLDDYNPMFTPNTTDLPRRRYAFEQQASIALWNLERLASALMFLTQSMTETHPKAHEEFTLCLEFYISTYNSEYFKMMSHKLGLIGELNEEDRQRILELKNILQKGSVDWTLFYHSLRVGNSEIEELLKESKDSLYSLLNNAFYESPSDEFKSEMNNWLEGYFDSVLKFKDLEQERLKIMDSTNPKFIPRNYILYQVIEDVEKGNFESFNEFYKTLKTPYVVSNSTDYKSLKRPDWAKNTAGCSTLSCSS
jgi:uncharacterized protein YdiU (UPF0061 family)